MVARKSCLEAVNVGASTRCVLQMIPLAARQANHEHQRPVFGLTTRSRILLKTLTWGTLGGLICTRRASSVVAMMVDAPIRCQCIPQQPQRLAQAPAQASMEAAQVRRTGPRATK